MMGTHGEQGEKPRLFPTLKFRDLLDGLLQKCTVIRSPATLDVTPGKGFPPQHALKTDGRHESILSHVGKVRRLRVPGRVAQVDKSLRQAGGTQTIRQGQVFLRLQCRNRQLAVIPAQQGIQTANGLVPVGDKIGQDHALAGEPIQIGHFYGRLQFIEFRYRR